MSGRRVEGGLGDAIGAEERLVADVEARVAEEREQLERFKDLFEQRQRLYAEQARLRRERLQTERRLRALEARAEREERRSERLAASADGSRRGRPVRIDVDDGAWVVVKGEAARRRVWLVGWVGELVRVEVEALVAGEVSGRPSERRRRSPGEVEPQPRRRFLRIDIDDEQWADFRSRALEVDLTVGRYVGELAEAAAYGAGWRAGRR